MAPSDPEVFICDACGSRLIGSRDDSGAPHADPLDGPKLQRDYENVSQALREEQDARRNYETLYLRLLEQTTHPTEEVNASDLSQQPSQE